MKEKKTRKEKPQHKSNRLAHGGMMGGSGGMMGPGGMTGGYGYYEPRGERAQPRNPSSYEEVLLPLASRVFAAYRRHLQACACE